MSDKDPLVDDPNSKTRSANQPTYGTQDANATDDADEFVRTKAQKRSCCCFDMPGWAATLLVALMVSGVVATIAVIGFVIKRPWLGLLALLATLPAFLFFLMWTFERRTSLSVTFHMCMFFFGFLGAIPIGVLEGLLAWGMTEMQSSYPQWEIRLVAALISAFLIAALIEETFKLVLVSIQARNAANAVLGALKGDYRSEAIIQLGVAGAIGFATLENLLYLTNPNNSFEGGVLVGIVRGLLSFPLHAMTGALIGAAIARRIVIGEKVRFLGILVLPYTLHGFFDFSLMVVAVDPGNEALLWTGFSCACVIALTTAIIASMVWYTVKVHELQLAIAKAPPSSHTSGPTVVVDIEPGYDYHGHPYVGGYAPSYPRYAPYTHVENPPPINVTTKPSK